MSGDFDDVEVARWPRKDGALILRRVTSKTGYSGWDIRVWIASENYTGWSKKGITLSDEELTGVVEATQERQAAVRSAIDS